ncbi:hypothetical protein DHEL01_v204648 [Diaporthe helianthi]|uniref:Uncharacterized protein n=1 Tax=Diaporthe helianthi TaxID=158607 RepID=A0A2P5I361_DIAHE|nr:hypothetical protein DHEL01_v204648 [Diaporthe helianthi]
MADPLSAIGAVSAIVQLVGAVSSGLRALRDAVVSIKDAPRTVQRLEEKIQHLGHCFQMLEKYFQTRPSKIPYETQLYELIQEIAASCTTPLKILKEKTPTRLSRKNVASAFDLWLNNSAISQAKTQINESIPYLNLLLQTLNLFKADQTDDLLRQIAASLNQTAQPQHPLPNQIAAVYELNTSHSLETTLRGIRTFANDATAFVVQSVSTTTATSSRYVGTLRAGDTPAVSSTAQSPSFPKARRQLVHEWEQNRKDLERLVGYGLFENAEKIQRRALLIKEELSNQHGIPFLPEERDQMEEQLADILIECKTEGSKEKAVSLIERVIGGDSRDRAVDNSNRPRLLTSPLSPTSDQKKKLSLHYKLGRLYKSTGQMDLAEKELRTAFNAYAEESPQDTAKIRETGQELLELYDIRVEFGDREHRPVFLCQLHGFKQELQSLIGRPLDNRQTTSDKALEWCEKQGIVVSRENQDEPRFDILDDEGSSPLHHAAEKCQDELALQQMMENSDTLENRDGSGDTPLLAAVGCSNTTALAVLLQKGASAKARDSQQQTPLHRSQKPSVTRALLHHRLRRASTMTTGLFDESDARRRRPGRFSSVSSAVSSSSSTSTTSPPSSIAGPEVAALAVVVAPAAHAADAAVAAADQDLLDIDAQDAHRKTALYLACSQGRDRIVSLLLQAGADPNIAAHESTPLSITIESQARAYMRDPRKKVDIVAALVSRGADVHQLLGHGLGPAPSTAARRASSPLSSRHGMHKEIQRALEGRCATTTTTSAPLMLLRQGLVVSDENWTLGSSSSRRDSGYQPSLSSRSVASSASKPQIEHLDFGPALTEEFGRPD